jgi:hypothetical protein
MERGGTSGVTRVGVELEQPGMEREQRVLVMVILPVPESHPMEGCLTVFVTHDSEVRSAGEEARDVTVSSVGVPLFGIDVVVKEVPSLPIIESDIDTGISDEHVQGR